ncbi:hypothetical protein [Sodalis-like endosymbiont of Proechinophthirus fluctus]|uniref:hypothetical protein n=1 Tax=Sodalis-like endosymbiont of Proechinophthirus fluctus TaxID=1462730 RepID=UPI0019572F90|nr:hypothetical protein [Sodalis-like endosymbiont of Proechinophthirus fluctus]
MGDGAGGVAAKTSVITRVWLVIDVLNRMSHIEKRRDFLTLTLFKQLADLAGPVKTLRHNDSGFLWGTPEAVFDAGEAFTH